MGSWVPSATYRLQLGPRLRFDDARRLLPYLDRLGVDTVYLSPVLAARPGSTHGYDGVDPTRLDTARGGEEAFRRLARAVRAHGMGLLVDIVPNHLAAVPENPAWIDVLEHGRRSRFARLFDIDWDRSPDRRPAVVLPCLDRPLDEAFRSGQVAFVRAGRTLALRVGVALFPASPRARATFDRWSRRAGISGRPSIDRSTRTLLAEINCGAAPRALALRGLLLRELAYRPVPWWETGQVNYRRFFDINELVGVRTETDAGFAYVHRWLREAVAARRVQGVRVDHVDGLADPGGYLRRLRRSMARASRARDGEFYVVVEKILGRDERLPDDWPVAGTTGYELIDRITHVLLPSGVEAGLEAAYRRACPDRAGSFADEAYRAKREVERALFPGDLAALERRFGRATGAPGSRPEAVRRALGALTAGLGVYRTYAHRGRRRPADRRAVARAAAEVRRREPSTTRVLAFGTVRRRLVGPVDPFVVRWQQWSGAVAAKGVEDTAFYRYVRFVGANEVGGDPGRLGLSLPEFHAFLARRRRDVPHALSATSTHDTKWGEDARARFVALSEHVPDWSATVARWRRAHARFARTTDGARSPSPTEEYRLYQALVGTTSPRSLFPPEYLRRVEAHLVKAAREAKEATRWTWPNAEHEAGLVRFVRALARDPAAAPFRRELRRWVRRVAYFGAFYSLAQVVLRSTVPGVPDLYQGSEGWNFSLVDPDNRRPVDFDRLARALARLDREAAGVPRRSARRRRTDPPDETEKLRLTAALLRFRRAHRPLVDSGDYRPVYERLSDGTAPVLAFARRHAREWLLVAVGRGLARVGGPAGGAPVGRRWGRRSLALPSGAPREWKELLSVRSLAVDRAGGRRSLRLAELFAERPVAVLYGTTVPERRPVAPNDAGPPAARQVGASGPTGVRPRGNRRRTATRGEGPTRRRPPGRRRRTGTRRSPR